MKQANDILEELRSMGSPLADMSRKMPFSVPADYFDSLPGEVQNNAYFGEIEDPLPALWTKEVPFAVPTGYFQGLPESITAHARLSERLEQLPRTMPLTAPIGYFDHFPDQVRAAAHAGEPAEKRGKTIPLFYRKTNWSLRWVAAAVVLLMATIGGIETLYNHPAYMSDKILASVPGEDIHEYLLHNTGIKVDVDKIINNNEISNLPLENKDIIDYLNETGWD